MHPKFPQAGRLSGDFIGAAIEVHRLMGPGLLESIYEKCLLRELELIWLATADKKAVRIELKGVTFGEALRFDVMVENCVLVELKAVLEVLPIHRAQLMNYMKLLAVPLGRLINFHEGRLVDGVHRLLFPGANR